MKENQPTKEYKTPQFQLILHEESNKVFFVASGSGPMQAATLSKIENW